MRRVTPASPSALTHFRNDEIICRLFFMINPLIKIKRYSKMAAFVVLLLVFPTHSALADVVDEITILTFLSTALSFFSWMLGLMAAIFDFFVNGFFLPPQVEATWALIRNFINMFFILIMIVMAFGTIFEIEKYSWRQMLLRLIVIALFVNFSFAIGVYLVDISNSLINLFIKPIGSITGTLGQGFGLGKLSSSGIISETALNFFKAIFTTNKIGAIVTAIFSLIFVSVAFFALTYAAIFAVVRIPMIWFLLVVSPAAWVGSILPNLRAETWSKWWKEFIGWTFFLPVYILILAFGAIFINSKGTINSYIATTNTASQYGSTLSFLFNLFSLGDIFYYTITLIIVVGGLQIAKEISFLAGTQAVAMFDKIESKVNSAAKATGRYGARVTGLSALQKGAKSTLERIKEEGLPAERFGALRYMYRGEQAERQRTAGMGERLQTALGYRPDLAGQKEFLNRANKEYENIKQQYDLGRINIAGIRTGVSRFNANTTQGFAYRKMLGEVGQLDQATAHDTIRSLERNPYAAVNFIKNSSSKGRLSALSPAEIGAMASAERYTTPTGIVRDYSDLRTNIGARKELFRHIQGDARVASGLTGPQFDQAMTLFGGRTTAEGSNFLKEVGKVRPDLVADYNVVYPPDPTRILTRLQYIESLITSAKDIANIPYAVTGRNIWAIDLDFRAALQNLLRRGTFRRRSQFRANLEDAITETGRDVALKLAVVAALA